MSTKPGNTVYHLSAMEGNVEALAEALYSPLLGIMMPSSSTTNGGQQGESSQQAVANNADLDLHLDLDKKNSDGDTALILVNYTDIRIYLSMFHLKILLGFSYLVVFYL